MAENEPAVIPPKSEWKTYAVPVTDRTFGYLRVLAPNPKAAADRAERYVDRYENDYQDLDFGGRESGDVVVDLDHDGSEWQDEPNETPGKATVEWDPEED